MIKRLLKLKIRFLSGSWKFHYGILRAYAREIDKLQKRRDEICVKIKHIQEELNVAQEEYGDNYK